MSQQDLAAPSPRGRFLDHLKGHILQFDRTSAPEYDQAAGNRLLLIFLLLEAVVGPRMWLLTASGLPAPATWLKNSILLFAALVLVRYFAGLSLSQIGLRPWRSWSTTEKSYFVQTIILANGIFFAVSAGRLRQVFDDPALRNRFWVMAASYLLWGFYQEVIYRGILQTELVRRWGVIPGILVSNTIYTFGPLHFYHFSALSPTGAAAMFASIFAIGLFFAAVKHRSGNLWMVGVFHGIGDVYLSGLSRLR